MKAPSVMVDMMLLKEEACNDECFLEEAVRRPAGGGECDDEAEKPSVQEVATILFVGLEQRGLRRF